MSLEQRINEDLKVAMKAKDQAALRGIRAIKSAILLLKTDGSHNEIDEDAEIKMLQKLVKQRKDSLAVYQQQKRDDLAKTEEEEIEVINRYLPQQLSEEDIRLMLSGLITQAGAGSMKDMGKVMALAGKAFAGKAENATIARILKEMLGS
jgi:uncharacterized protein YqeY